MDRFEGTMTTTIKFLNPNEETSNNFVYIIKTTFLEF